MCGIHGFIDPKISKENSHVLIQKMVDSTSHRGPDFAHTWHTKDVFLGHNRLSILDLSANGNQPMQIDHLTIVFNGEIYNYKEIRSQLVALGHTFKTESDTEVILKAYLVWQENMLDKFLGMWAFAIWDDLKNELFCARDRFGIKPFYFIHEKQSIYFASEIKSLKKVPSFSKELNLKQISRFLQLGWLEYKSETIFQQVHTLSSGHYMKFTNGELKTVKYWDLDQIKETDLAPALAEQKFKDLFDNSLDLHLRSDVPITATLSGGIDSSSIVSSYLTNYPDKTIETYSIYYSGKKGVDERPFVEEIVAKFPNRIKTHYYSPNDEDIRMKLIEIMYHSDYPLAGSSPISQYFVMQEIAKDGFKVVLSGQGADDYLAGYMHSFYRFYADLMSHFQLKKLWSEIKIHAKNQNFGKLAMLKIIGKSFLSLVLSENKLYNLEYNRYLPFVMKEKEHDVIHLEKKGENRVSNFHRNLMETTSLPTLLHYEDRNSMAASIESRVPFLDHRLVEFGFSLASNHKIHKGFSKAVLRNAMKNVLPDAIRNRLDKKGFVTPGEILWLRGSLKEFLELDYDQMPFLNKSKCEHEIEKFKNGSDKSANLIWRLVTLSIWLKNS